MLAKSRRPAAPRRHRDRADGERIEAAFGQREQLIAQDVADRAKLALESVAVAQEAPDRVAAPVGERGKVDRDDRNRADVRRQRFGVGVRREPHADVAARDQRIAMCKPERKRDDLARAVAKLRQRAQFAPQATRGRRRARRP
jgi:hypothetical protein